MSEARILKPASDKEPAKIKDRGVVAMAMAGDAAYNAKSGELLLLPDGVCALDRVFTDLQAALLDKCGLQPVGCGSDEGIFSLAERYVRDWGELATAFSERRGRSLRLLGWSPDWESATAGVRVVMETILGQLGEGFAFVEEVQPTEGRAFVLVSPAEPGTLRGVNGFACPACGRLLLADSPTGYCPKQPDEAEEEPEEISTPGANTILDLCAQLDLPIDRTIKAMLYVAENTPIAAFVRGDFNISMNKLSNWLYRAKGLSAPHTAEGPELTELFGEVAGYCGPVRLNERVTVVCDESVRGTKNMVVGANRPGYHLRGVCHGRDYRHEIADIAGNVEGMPCSCGKASLKSRVLRVAGVIGFGVGHQMTVFNNDDEKMYKLLSCRTREGANQYPIQWRGNISAESVILSSSARSTGY